ncbi:MAG: response regulator [Elusimicrobiales bacterium]|nr:response regulator [Elusimicrobiales bacterium]
MFKKKGFSTFEISKICGVYPSTVINWINQGKLKSYVTPGGHHRVTKQDLLDFLKEYNFPIPQELVAEKKKIFIVDDDEVFRKSLVKAFSKKNNIFEIYDYEDGYSALIALGNNKPDLMLIDIVMPKIDGITLIKKVKEDKNLSSIRFIVITGEADGEDIKEIKRLIDGYFRKPVEFNKIIEFVCNLFK